MKKIICLFVFNILVSSSYSQISLSEPEINELALTYSYYLNQKNILSKITNNYSTLKIEVINAEYLWNSKFSASIDNIYNVLNTYFKEKLKEIENKNNYNDISELTFEDSKLFLKEFNKRIEGNMPTPIIETLLSYNPRYQNNPELEFSDGYYQDYCTSRSSKHKDVNIKFKYPISWNAKNGDRPNVIQKFTSYNGHGLETALILINKLNETPSVEQIEYFLSKEVLITQLPKNSEIITYQQNLKLDNINSSTITFYSEQTRMNVKIGTIIEIYIFYYKNNQVTLMFSVGQNVNERDNLYKNYEKYKKLFWRMANNLVLLSQYE